MNRRRVKAFAGKLWRQWRLAIFLIVFVVLPVKSSVADFNWVPSGSMKPTILEGDFILLETGGKDIILLEDDADQTDGVQTEDAP